MRANNREELENRKLALEIAELKKPWYLKPANILPVATVILTICTVFWTIKSGILDLKNESLRKERKILELDIKEFETTKTELKRDNTRQHLIADSLTNAVASLQKQKQVISKDIQNILNQYNSESSKVSALIKKIATLNAEYDKKVVDTIMRTNEYYLRVMDRKLSEEEKLRQQTWDLQRKIDICQNEYRYLEDQLKKIKMEN